MTERSTAEQMAQNIEVFRRTAAAFGEIVSILMKSPNYRNLPLKELDVLVLPALNSGQFSIAEAKSQDTGLPIPMGIVLWASVSDSIHRRLEAEKGPVRLAKNEWNSGENIWLVEASGEQHAVGAMLNRLRDTVFKGKVINVRAAEKQQ